MRLCGVSLDGCSYQRKAAPIMGTVGLLALITGIAVAAIASGTLSLYGGFGALIGFTLLVNAYSFATINNVRAQLQAKIGNVQHNQNRP